MSENLSFISEKGLLPKWTDIETNTQKAHCRKIKKDSILHDHVLASSLIKVRSH